MISKNGASGVTWGEGADGELVPMALVRATVKLYVVPLVNPFSTCDVAEEVTVF